MSEFDPPSHIHTQLKRSPAWSEAGILSFEPEWIPLDKRRGLSPDVPGIYAIGFAPGVKYANGNSKVIYVGSSNRIRRRLATHARRSHSEWIQRMVDQNHDKLLVCWWTLPGLPDRWLRGLECTTLEEFDICFGDYPICNQALPDSTAWEKCDGLIEINFASEIDGSMSTVALAESLDLPLQRSISKSWVTFSSDEDGRISVRGEDRSSLLGRAETPVSELKDDEIAYLAFIHHTHIAVWSCNKIRTLLACCANLLPEKSKRKTTVLRFDSAAAKPPYGNSWGEVAMLKGRMLCGTWTPLKRCHVKILHGKTVLGQAILSKSGFSGEDLHDCPQIKKPRPQRWNEQELSDPSPAWEKLIEKQLQKEERIRRELLLLEDMEDELGPESVAVKLSAKRQEHRDSKKAIANVISTGLEHGRKQRLRESIEAADRALARALQDKY